MENVYIDIGKERRDNAFLLKWFSIITGMVKYREETEFYTWTLDVVWTFKKRPIVQILTIQHLLQDFHQVFDHSNVFWASFVLSIFVLCPGGQGKGDLIFLGGVCISISISNNFFRHCKETWNEIGFRFYGCFLFVFLFSTCQPHVQR